MTPFEHLIAAERHRQRPRLRRAALLAALVAAASVLLLGLSGWFITAAAYAGAAGILAAHAFNYMLPSAGIRLLAIVRTGARYGERLASHDAAFAALARIRPALFRAVAASPVARALSLTTGEATARMVQDVDAVEARFVRLSAPWALLAAFASGIALLLIGGWKPALAVVLTLGLLLLLARRLSERLRAPGAAVQRATGLLKEEAAFLAEAAPELRCYGLEDWAAARIAERSAPLGAAVAAQAHVHAWFEGLHALAIGLAAALALLLAAPAGAAVAALCALAGAMTIDGAAPLLRALAQRGAVEEAESRLAAWFADAAPPAPDAVPAQCLSIDGHAIGRGACVALTGPSGCGKTSLLESLIGLRAPPPGRITVDGADPAALPLATLRASFAWMPQDAMLVSGTVRNNLRLAAPEADEAALWRALADAALDDRVRTLPHGLDSWVGQGGERLSGGERRRLALARAFLSGAPWLLLDEPAEGLDPAAEARLIDGLRRRLEQGRGAILVSHRPGILALCARRIEVCIAPGTAEAAPEIEYRAARA